LGLRRKEVLDLVIVDIQDSLEYTEDQDLGRGEGV
jgi:hypothetical protein